MLSLVKINYLVGLGTMDMEEKISQIELILKEPSFFENKSYDGYYIFDYDPKYELQIRAEVSRLKEKFNSNKNFVFNIVEFDLYEIIINILIEKGYLDKVFDFEKKKGRDKTRIAITQVLRLSSDSNLIVKHIKENVEEDSIVFLTGVGKVFPIVRSHNIINSLYDNLDYVPLIIFFPGNYTGINLCLFNTIDDCNHYRAKLLVD